MEIDSILCRSSVPVYKAIAQMNDIGKGVVFVVDSKGRLIRILTDGDVRRAVLVRFPLERSVADLIEDVAREPGKYASVYSAGRESIALSLSKQPIYAHIDSPVEELLALVSDRVRIIPLVDDDQVVRDYFEYKTAFHVPIAAPTFSGNELPYVMECVETNWISSQGRFVSLLEDRFAAYCGSAFGVTVANGTVALHLALEALGIGKGDEVIVPDLTFAATINAVIHAGATPVIVDVEADSWCLCPLALAKAVTERTKAVIPVHLYGQPAAMDEIMAVARKYDLYVIEDCAEAPGACYNGRKVGNLGDIGCFSFFGNKIITSGEGGFCTTSDKGLCERMRILRDHGMNPNRKYWHDVVGYNYRMTNLQAAVALAQLEQIDHFLEQRAKIEKRYESAFSSCVKLSPQRNLDNRVRVCWLVCYLLASGIDRDELLARAAGHKIDLRPFFLPLSDMPIYKDYAPGPTPVAHELSACGICLPTSLSLKADDYEYITRTIIALFDKSGGGEDDE